MSFAGNPPSVDGSGGPPLIETPPPEGRESVIARLQAAFEQVAADQRNDAAAKAMKNR